MAAPSYDILFLALDAYRPPLETTLSSPKRQPTTGSTGQPVDETESGSWWSCGAQL